MTDKNSPEKPGRTMARVRRRSGKRRSQAEIIKRHGAEDDPTRLCVLYSTGIVDRDSLIRGLTKMHYEAQDRTDGIDTLIIANRHSWDAVESAYMDGTIDADTYDEILKGIVEE